jgi:hypothetical protein
MIRSMGHRLSFQYAGLFQVLCATKARDIQEKQCIKVGSKLKREKVNMKVTQGRKGVIVRVPVRARLRVRQRGNEMTSAMGTKKERLDYEG